MTRETRALLHSFARFKMLADHALTPAFKKTATEGAGYCLFALGIDEFEGFKAMEPEGKQIEATALPPMIETRN